MATPYPLSPTLYYYCPPPPPPPPFPPLPSPPLPPSPPPFFFLTIMSFFESVQRNIEASLERSAEEAGDPRGDRSPDRSGGGGEGKQRTSTPRKGSPPTPFTPRTFDKLIHDERQRHLEEAKVGENAVVSPV